MDDAPPPGASSHNAAPIEDEDLLISVSGGLGHMDEERNVYVKDQDCTECLKDLQRFLRRDDVFERPVFHRLGQWDLVSTDLVPLIVHHQDDADVVYNALKVLTFLTMPIEPQSDLLSEQCKHLKRIKQCFLANDALAVIVGLLAGPLSRYPRLPERDILVTQLVLTFVRNIMCIDSAEHTLGIDGGPSADYDLAQGKADLLQRLFRDNVLEIVLLVAQHANEKTFKNDAPLILHILHQVFEGFDAAQLFGRADGIPSARGRGEAISKAKGIASNAGGGRARTTAAGAVAKSELALALSSERRARITGTSFTRLPPRHRQFSGTFVKKYADVSQQYVFTQRSMKPGIDRDDMMGGGGGGRRGRRAFAFDGARIPMPGALQPLLCGFVDGLLDGGYDVLMDTIRPELMHGIGISRYDKEDYMRFFKLSRFCTSYVKLKVEKEKEKEKERDAMGEKGNKGPASPFSSIGATLGWDMFHLLLTVWSQQIELPTRADDKDWALQGASLALLKEMLGLLHVAYERGSRLDRQAADKLSRRLLHDDLKQSGLFPLLCKMMKQYVKRKKKKEKKR